jgi:ATP-dependent Clp protease ATP-binding subunit ClpC
MNDAALRELKTVVERAVRPVQATMARKRKIREELLAHLVSIFEEEAERLGDEQAALAEAKLRFGDPRELSGQLQQTVPAWSRCRFLLEKLRLEPGESLLHFAGKNLLVTFVSYLLVIPPFLPRLAVAWRVSEISTLVRILLVVGIRCRLLWVPCSRGSAGSHRVRKRLGAVPTAGRAVQSGVPGGPPGAHLPHLLVATH